MSRYQVPDSVIKALIQQESGGDNNAVSPKGALGLTQIMPETAKNPGFGVTPLRSNDPQERIRFTRDYLGALVDETGSLPLGLAAYNIGLGAVKKAGGIPKVPETMNYVDNIMKAVNPIGTAEASEQPYKSEFQKWLADNPEGRQVQQPQPQTQQTQPQSEFQKWLAENPEPAQPQEETSSPLSHKAEVAARGVLEGFTGLPGDLYNLSQIGPQLLARGVEKYTGFKHPMLNALPSSIDTSQAGNKLASMMGLDTATEEDNIIYPASKVIGGYVLPATGMAKLGTGAIQGIGAALGGNSPILSMGAVLGGKTAAEIARQQGAPDSVQIAADILGNVGVAGAASAASGIVKSAGKAGKALAGAGLEGVAGRTLNKAAGENSAIIAGMLEAGKVPTIAKPIPGYAPTTSEIAGDAGVSTVLRSAQLDASTLSPLNARKFGNAKAVSSYAERAAGSAAKRADMEEKGLEAIERIAKPMRTRNAPVDLDPVRAAIDEALSKHAGNPAITKALTSLKKTIPAGSTAGFNEVYNFKQYIDETLRGNPMTDPKVASMQRAASALQGVKASLADTLTQTEPGFKDYIKAQAINIKQMGSRDAAKEIVDKSRLSAPFVANTLQGQEEVYPIAANRLLQKLGNEKNLTPAQIRQLENAAQHAKLSTRSNAGLMTNSSTAQNFSVKNALFNDIMNINPNGKNGIIDRVASTTTRLLEPALLGKVASENTAEISRILARAELDPKYAAMLMQKYGLGHMSFKGAVGQAALRSTLENAAKGLNK